MVINRKKLSNPYLKAYADIKGVPDGSEIVVTEYMIWFEQKYDEYRRLHNMEEHEELDKDQQQDFLDFLWMK